MVWKGRNFCPVFFLLFFFVSLIFNIYRRDERRRDMNYGRVKRPFYDIDEILDNITGRDVAEHFGLEIIHKGAYDFIHCPGHIDRLGKEDRKANNCVLLEHGYHCYACGETVGILRMIEEIEGCSKYDAIGIAGDIAGGRELYQTNDGCSHETVKKERLCSNDLKFIGLLQFKKKPYFPENVTFDAQNEELRESKEVDIIKSYTNGENGDLDTEYLVCRRKKHLGLSQLYRDDYEAYCFLVRNKALETAKKYQKLIQLWCTSNPYSQMMQKVLPYNMQSVMNEFRHCINHAHQIYLRFQQE